jgi:hypothetical protein
LHTKLGNRGTGNAQQAARRGHDNVRGGRGRESRGGSGIRQTTSYW